MMRTSIMPLAAIALAGWAALVPARAAPPTVTPSPGYDARLQEQRAGTSTTSTVQQPVAPVVAPVQPRRGKKTPAH
jgi:phosphoribosylcarboxyaminoimidazole (NCAIR) mutase